MTNELALVTSQIPSQVPPQELWHYFHPKPSHICTDAHSNLFSEAHAAKNDCARYDRISYTRTKLRNRIQKRLAWTGNRQLGFLVLQNKINSKDSNWVYGFGLERLFFGLDFPWNLSAFPPSKAEQEWQSVDWLIGPVNSNMRFGGH